MTHISRLLSRLPQTRFAFRWANGKDSFQLLVGVFDTYLVWYLLVLPSETNAVANMTSLRAIDGGASYNYRNPSHYNYKLLSMP